MVSSSYLQQKEEFELFKTKYVSTKVGNNDFTESVRYGSVKISSAVYRQVYVIYLHNVLYVLDVVYTSISLSQALKRRFKVFIDDDKNERRGCRKNSLPKRRKIVKLVGNETKNGLYEVQTNVIRKEGVIA